MMHLVTARITTHLRHYKYSSAYRPPPCTLNKAIAARPPISASMACFPRFSHVALLLLSLLLLSPSSANRYLTWETGHRVGTNQHSQTATSDGPILLQDVYTLEKLRRFNTERIPERVVHARGTGAHGFFRTFTGIPHLTAAHFLSAPDIFTDVFVRFSIVIHSKHSPETLRDVRGFSIKFNTEREGIWDMVGNNLPVFFIRDHIKFPDLIHSLKPDPITNIQDPNRFFDFFAALGGQATHMLTYLYSNLGIPKTYRFMNGNGVHAYKMVNAAGEVRYVKFRWFSQQGVRNLTAAEAVKVQGMDFNHATRDLYESISKGDYPRWNLAIQVMEPSQLDDFDFDPLDATKNWPEDQFPFMEIGELVVNRVPDNYFLTTEQVAFDPGNFLPGAIEPSEDRLLQGRLISYHETQTHRHGSNVFQWLPINRAKTPINNYNQNGVMVMEHAWNGTVNYEPSNDPNAYQEDKRYLYSTKKICGMYRQEGIKKTLNFRQAGENFRSFNKKDQNALVMNLASDLKTVKSQLVQNTMCSHFFKADEKFGRVVAGKVDCDMPTVMMMASKLEE